MIVDSSVFRISSKKYILADGTPCLLTVKFDLVMRDLTERKQFSSTCATEP